MSLRTMNPASSLSAKKSDYILRSGDVDLSESETWCFLEEAVTGRPLLIKQLRGNPKHPVNQTAREVQQLKEKNGHTIYTSLIYGGSLLDR